MSIEALATLPYQPSTPRNYRPKIGLIGCGGIAGYHLQAYQDAGLDVAAVCDIDLAQAQKRASEYFPEAAIHSNYQDLLRDDAIEVVDIATHPPERPPIVRDALQARKHVLSQKPFVLELDEGERLVELADQQDRYLAVNQNGRWAPHFSYARQVVEGGHIGQVFGAHLSCHWDHTWVEGTEFENVKHLILYDYAIHWFDIVRCFLPGKATNVFASTARIPGQTLMPDLLAKRQSNSSRDKQPWRLTRDCRMDHMKRRFSLEPRVRCTVLALATRSNRCMSLTSSASGRRNWRGPGSQTGFAERCANCFAPSRRGDRPRSMHGTTWKAWHFALRQLKARIPVNPSSRGTVRNLPA